MEIFDYDNILLLPRKCRVDSRSECDASVELGGRSITYVVVRDAFGRQLYRQTLSLNNQATWLDIPANEFPSGILFVSAYNGSQLVAVNKVVKE